MFKQPYKQNRKRQAGLSLVELMVSMAIGAVILSGAIVVYLDQLQSSRRLTAYAQLQESGRVALDIIERDLLMAGFTGCFSTKSVLNNTLQSGFPNTFQPQAGVQGWEANNSKPGDAIANVLPTTALVSTNSGWSTSGGNILGALDVVPNSDVLRIWGGGEFDIPVTGIIAGSPTVITVGPGTIEDDAILMLGDCESSDIIQACDVAAAANSSTITLSTSCSPGNKSGASLGTVAVQNPTITQLRGTTYIVSKQNGIATNPPSLFRAELNLNGAGVGNFEEVVQGVESMQILYGENRDGDNLKSVDAYVTANNVTNWENVISVRVSLLMQSVDDHLVDGAIPYVFNGVTYDGASGNPAPADNRLRRVFTRTITLRNRTLGS